MFEDVINNLAKQLEENRHKMVVEDIIDIYDGNYPSYDLYLKQKQKEVQQARKMNEKNFTNTNTYTFIYTPEPTIIDKATYDFIGLLRLKNRNES